VSDYDGAAAGLAARPTGGHVAHSSQTTHARAIARAAVLVSLAVGSFTCLGRSSLTPPGDRDGADEGSGADDRAAADEGAAEMIAPRPTPARLSDIDADRAHGRPVYPLNGRDWLDYVTVTHPRMPPGIATTSPTALRRHGAGLLRLHSRRRETSGRAPWRELVQRARGLGRARAFDWICDDAGGTATALSEGLKHGRGSPTS